jgi:hypothetical protein
MIPNVICNPSVALSGSLFAPAFYYGDSTQTGKYSINKKRKWRAIKESNFLIWDKITLAGRALTVNNAMLFL